MKKNPFALCCVLAALAITSCSRANSNKHSHGIDEQYIDEQGNLTEPIDIASHQEDEGPEDKYNEGVVLVETFEEFDTSLINLRIKSIESLYPNSSWKKIFLDGEDTVSSVKYLRETSLFHKVDYDYVMKAEADIESIDVSGNTYADDLSYLDTMCIGDAWGYANSNHLGGSNGGGSPDVVIAIIDTGVDYNHLDLRNNIWINAGEIPSNGIDDDNNGYVDDVRGWDCVNEDNDPIDDNGHGTHVAGIAAAENNNIGTVGVAFNCKIMPLKAANSSGVFNNSDIAQAVEYAYMNGASVINMSFGGSAISLAAQEALSRSYFQCSLIAAAGNSSRCDEPTCPYCLPYGAPFFPGSLPYVVGVMSCNYDGTAISSFSNYDHSPFHYNEYEYDCYACGEQIISTWPNNKYARLSGTSMSSPVVAGIAALLRSAYPDRELYSNKYIHSQLTNTGTKNPVTRIGNNLIIDEYHPVCNAYESLTRIPTPHINSLYRYYAFDNEDLSIKNNQDGFINSGETIKLGIELQNRGGKATNVTASIDTIRNDDPNITDPNVEILTGTINFSDIGTYSIADGGKIYQDDKVVDMENAFLIKISDNCPNSYLCSFNLSITYNNGLDENDHTLYYGRTSFTISVSRGVRLSGYITEDTTFSSENEYLITDNLIIGQGVTVTFSEGCIIRMYGDSAAYLDTIVDSPTIDVYGTLIMDGTEDNNIVISVSDLWEGFFWRINNKGSASRLNFRYVTADRGIINQGSGAHANNTFYGCTFSFDNTTDYTLLYADGVRCQYSGLHSYVGQLDNCYFSIDRSWLNFHFYGVQNSVIVIDKVHSGTELDLFGNTNRQTFCENNVFLCMKNNNTNYNLKVCLRSTNSATNWHYFRNNSLVLGFIPTSVADLPKLHFCDALSTTYRYIPICENNHFPQYYIDNQISLITENINSSGEIILNPLDDDNFDSSLLWPYIEDISIFDGDNNVLRTVGTDSNTVRVTFSKNVDISNDFSLFYGSWYPYADYEIVGDYVSASSWEGTFQVKANIEGGIQYFSSNGSCDSEDSFKKMINNSSAFTFNIDTSSAFAMNLQANLVDEGIELTWVQDDYETLMGYNIYRSNSKDGNFAKINPSIIPADENTFIDDSCEPGETYWYTFTVVLSDFSESSPAGKVCITARDTISPVIYHTPVNQGYAGNNLVINCSISDNISVESATLYYRTVGDEAWKSLPMTATNDRFSATIYGSEVTLSGLEYYISATDGTNTITRGDADSPFMVVVKDASLLNNIGDVDGDGSITTKDALMIIRAINDELILTDDQFQRADLNKDGELSTFEALRILQYINGNVTTLEM